MGHLKSDGFGFGAVSALKSSVMNRILEVEKRSHRLYVGAWELTCALGVQPTLQRFCTPIDIARMSNDSWEADRAAANNGEEPWFN